MRKKLQHIANRRNRFFGTVKRFSFKPMFRGQNQKTVLISDIYLADKNGNPIGDEPLTDHIWFVAGKWSQTLKVGDRIAFNARVEKYEKGYKGYQAGYETPIEVDYCLKRPTKVEVIKIS